METEDLGLNSSCVPHLLWTRSRPSLRSFLHMEMAGRPTLKGLKLEPVTAYHGECENILQVYHVICHRSPVRGQLERGCSQDRHCCSQLHCTVLCLNIQVHKISPEPKDNLPFCLSASWKAAYCWLVPSLGEKVEQTPWLVVCSVVLGIPPPSLGSQYFSALCLEVKDWWPHRCNIHHVPLTELRPPCSSTLSHVWMGFLTVRWEDHKPFPKQQYCAYNHTPTLTSNLIYLVIDIKWLVTTDWHLVVYLEDKIENSLHLQVRSGIGLCTLVFPMPDAW